MNDLATLEPELASQWHLTLNAQGPDQFTRVAEAKVWWRCEYGHDWETKICSRTYSGSGCSVCSNLVVLKGFNDLATTHPHLVDEWDAAANDMTPDSVVFGSNYKASWVCARGHSWMAKVATRTGGYKSGCPVCGTTTSKPEEVMRVALGICTPSVALLESHCLLPLPWRKRKHLRVDSAGFLASDPSMPFVCEYDGAYFHRREDDVKRDIEKTVILLDAGYTVVRIREQAKNLPLPALPLQHPRLLQIDFKVPYGAAAQNQMDEVMKGTAQRIEEWVLANTSEARHRG
ncbi:zinc-ribbon domain-containing protein [Arthrobacter sp. MPF02]|uniref:zinc-ribbon domain-containing protein n=1 Tax=Arthrobacter sp. MPF02 TaxID=3388492 RepID=UPI003984934D